jgi:hypothetical protein
MAGRLLVVAGDRTINGAERQAHARPRRLQPGQFPGIVTPKQAHERAGQQMEKLTFGNVVGFVLAVLFALVIGISMWALLIGDYMNTVMNEQTRHTLRIVGFAGALAALATWWVQSFAAKRGFVVRFMFAFFIFVVAFCSFGGLLRFIYIHATYPNQQDWSVTGMYLASLNDFYTFLLDMLLPPRPAYAALTVAAAIFVAWFGPREARTADI